MHREFNQSENRYKESSTNQKTDTKKVHPIRKQMQREFNQSENRNKESSTNHKTDTKKVQTIRKHIH